MPVRVTALIDDAALTRHCSNRFGTPQLDETGGVEEEQKYSNQIYLEKPENSKPIIVLDYKVH